MQKISYKQKFDVIVFINYVLITVNELDKLQFTIYNACTVKCYTYESPNTFIIIIHIK